MPKEYTKEQLLKLYENLPKELQEALFSMETADHIWNICERNNALPQPVADYVGHVLLGVLAPDELQKTLEQEVKFEKEVAKKVAQEVNRFIFYPVKPALEQLYKTEVTPAGEEKEKPIVEKPEIKPTSEDRYREPLE